MAYDESVASRLREALAATPAVTEMKMFGGLAFLVCGHMAVCAVRDGGLLLRCQPSATSDYLGEHVTRFVMRGKEMDGWLHVHPAAFLSDADLSRFVAIGVDYVSSLPPK